MGKKPTIGFKIEVVVEPDGEGFHSFCPALKGLHSYGDTEKEALENAKNAAILYLESSIKHGDPLPIGIVVNEECLLVHSSLAPVASKHTENLQVQCVI